MIKQLYLSLHVLCVVLFIHIRLRNVIFNGESGVSDLDGQACKTQHTRGLRPETQKLHTSKTQKSSSERLTILQVQQTCLTNIFHFAAGLADFCLLETHSRSWTPPEHGKGPSTNLDRQRMKYFKYRQVLWGKAQCGLHLHHAYTVNEQKKYLAFFPIFFLGL